MTESLSWLDRLAHDLRGPLMPLQTAAYLLRRGEVDPERQQELLALIERQTRRLAGMIDELGDWSRVLQRTLLLAREPCVPALLLDDAIGANALVERFRPDIVDDSGDAQVEGDPVRLTQLLRTLLEFATRLRPARVRMHAVDGELRIEVLDTGATPDAGQLATLLEQPMPEPFDEGLGLRMLIARAIAEAHAGSLEAGVAPGGGLRLDCRLPLAAV
jgi:signal transduction histidine kinase